MFSTSPRRQTMRFSRFRTPAPPVRREEPANSSSLTLTCLVLCRWLWDRRIPPIRAKSWNSGRPAISSANTTSIRMGAERSVLRHPHWRRGKDIQTTTSFVCDEGNFIVELTQDLCPPAALARQPAAQESRVAVSRVSSHTSASTKASPPDLIGPQHSDVPARESSLRNRPE
jgi:hypothetical protein